MAVANTQQEVNVLNIIKCTLTSLYYNVVRVRIKRGKKNKTLQIMIERENNKNITINDCQKVTKVISPLLDKADIITESYNLEVSSPGVNKPLTRKKDFEKALGKNIKVTTYYKINGKRNIFGKLNEVKGNELIICETESNENIIMHLDVISEAYLQYDELLIS